MTHILIIFWTVTYGNTIGVVEFDSLAACQVAAEAIREEKPQIDTMICARKK